MHKFKIGDKVVPINKTRGQGLYASVNWAMAKDMNQPFLYVNGLDCENAYTCGYSTVNGDFFNEDDLVLYEENTIDLNLSNLPKITEGQAKVIEHLKESWGELAMINLHLSDLWTDERAVLNSIEPLDFIKAAISGYEIVEKDLEWTITLDEFHLGSLVIRSNWDTWEKCKEQLTSERPISKDNGQFHLYMSSDIKSTSFTIDDAKKLKSYLTKVIEYLED